LQAQHQGAGRQVGAHLLTGGFGVALMATSNSPTYGQSNSPRQDG